MSSPYQPGFQSTQQGDRSKSEFSFAPGETNIFVTHYSPSLMTAWLKTELTVTSRRLLARKSNTLLGVIPLGHDDAAMPLGSISEVGVNSKFHPGRAIMAIVWLVLMISMFNAHQPVLGILALLLLIVAVLTTMDAELRVVNNAGSVTSLTVSALEKAKLQSFKQEVEQRLYADQALLMHRESMNQAQNFATIQQAQMSALLAQGQLQNQLSSDKGQQPPPRCRTRTSRAEERIIGKIDDWPAGPFGRPICVRSGAPRNEALRIARGPFSRLYDSCRRFLSGLPSRSMVLKISWPSGRCCR